MSFWFPAGLVAAAFVETFFLGTLLLFFGARWWKAREINLVRAAGLCAAIMAVPFVLSLTALALFDVANPTDAEALVLLMMLAVGIVLPWYLAKRILATGWWRAVAVWLCAWLPLALVNTALGMTTRFLFTESYIVPTGAMAPTIIGAHADRVCSNCGCQFYVARSPTSLPTMITRLTRRSSNTWSATFW